ncbi:pilin protein [Burkholderia ambifaria]|uniref:CfaE/CblD family pilus tip adhesin n=1 Tax=Burkholderia ambifaria TaxID=152480 RepID=UPI001588EF20|nr:CfaE/CblD family pilus tip adhesin [Burkholderia ambifaria]UEP46744.1 pilin protein [Burkholderia ambifaria]
MTQLNRNCYQAIVLAAALGVVAVNASAVMQAPADRNDTVEATLDRGAPLGDVVIFNKASGGYDTSDHPKWGRNAWTCQSAIDTATGACPTEPIWQAAGDSTVIKLSFREEKTGATAVLSLHGESAYIRHLDCSGNVIPEIVSDAHRAIEVAQSATVGVCPTLGWDGRAISVKIPAAELKKLPSGGTWKANLRLNLRLWGTTANAPVLAVFRAEIKLNATDKDNIQIYLPEFTTATPVVNLKLRTLPNGSRLSGTSNVDMCLYDGYNSQSTWFDVSANDGLTVDRRDKGQYSVLLDSDKSGAYASRLDYNVSLTYAGQKIALPNNETVRLQGVNNSAGRSVSLPGISVPVVCTPTPLTLETPAFQSAWKRPGKYSNKLTITFTPSAASL